MAAARSPSCTAPATHHCTSHPPAPVARPTTQKIQYAKTKSDAIAKLDGSYKPDKKKDRAKKNEAARGASPSPLCVPVFARCLLFGDQ